MLRPATPLTILLLAAFALLLISVISTPIVKQIPLASFGGVDFGVFGYCEGDKCSNIEIGYDTSKLFTASQSASFDLPSTTRHTLSAILIVHPVAALFTLVMLVLAAVAHLHSPSHSPRYLLGIFILSILTLILALLSFLIDVMLFVPHMAWGSYLVLAATVLIAASGIISCAMRRTLVSRKARKRRIAENAEMNGENFYSRQGGGPVPPITSSNTLTNDLSMNDKQPSFATFDTSKPEPDRTSDERVPLTTRTPIETSPTASGAPIVGMTDRYGAPPVMGRNPAGEIYRDQYGNPIPPLGPYGSRSRDPSADPSLNRQYSDLSASSRGRGGMLPPGGYSGRGGYNPNGRGGYGPPPRGGYGPRGGYAPPRGGYGGSYRGGMNDGMRGGRGAAPPMYAGAPRNGPGYTRDPSPAGPYGRLPSPPQQPGPSYGREAYGAPPHAGQYAPYNPESDRNSLPRAESPPPLPGLDGDGAVGQAIEMDATTGSPSNAPRGYGQFGNIRESDGDVAGMVGLQQQRLKRETTSGLSDTSRYSTDEAYVPPRQAWRNPGRSPILSPPMQQAPMQQTRKRANSSDNYYEDVDPRFAEQPVAAPPAIEPSQFSAPGYPPNNKLRPIQTNAPRQLDGSSSYEDLQSGARSPAESDRSNFTSVSQRGVNPRWNDGPGYAPMPNRRPVPPQNDILLNSNPDFQLSGGRGGAGGMRGGMRGRGMTPPSAYPGGSAL